MKSSVVTAMTGRRALVSIAAAIWFLLAGVPIISADSMPRLVWFPEDHPWASGIYGTMNQIGGGRLDEESVVEGTFMLEGTDRPAVVSWTYRANGIFTAYGGYNPWDRARLQLDGAGLVSWIGLDTPPYEWSDADLLWTLNETSAPLLAADTWGYFEVTPRQVRFTIQPGFLYQVFQYNWSGLNMFDLGYSQATLESSIELVPEPASLFLLSTGLGVLWLAVKRRSK